MTTAGAMTVGAPRREGGLALSRAWLVAFGVMAALVILELSMNGVGAFPRSWNINLANPIDDFERWVRRNRVDHPLFSWFVNPLSDALGIAISSTSDFLLWLPWFVLPAATFAVIVRNGSWVSATIAAAGALYPAIVDLWQPAMKTLALMAVAVAVSVVVGVPLGIWATLSPRSDRAMRPVLDAMQTVPSAVYLVPSVLFFGIGQVPAAAATIVYALPPAVRLTVLGIRQVPPATVEAGQMYGSTRRQLLTKVQLPQALPSIAVGVNQTIMMALGIVVIAALVGAGGLGQEVLNTLRVRSPGRGFVVGFAIVAIALVLDRVSRSFIVRPDRAAERRSQWRRSLGVAGGLAGAAVAGRAVGWIEIPVSWGSSFADPVDDAVIWVRYTFKGVTRPFNDFVVRDVLIRGRNFLLELAWPVVVLASVALTWLVRGWRLALFTAAGVVLTGLVGMWEPAVYTLVQVVTATFLAVAIAVPVGIWVGRRERVEAWLSPILDALQTIPSIIYAIPFVMIFTVSPVPGGIVASVIYAIPPGIRVTALGIRQVRGEVIEASTMFGASRRQTLWGVRVPLAMPSIVLAVNQVIMMVLAMVIIAGLTGAQALGYEAVNALTKEGTGLGVEVGIAIVVMAITLDRLTQGIAAKLSPPAATT